jgi:hypothetical protein
LLQTRKLLSNDFRDRELLQTSSNSLSQKSWLSSFLVCSNSLSRKSWLSSFLVCSNSL